MQFPPPNRHTRRKRLISLSVGVWISIETRVLVGRRVSALIHSIIVLTFMGPLDLYLSTGDQTTLARCLETALGSGYGAARIVIENHRVRFIVCEMSHMAEGKPAQRETGPLPAPARPFPVRKGGL